MNQFFLGSNQAKWWTIGLSVMATQASAITFLSTPGQAYAEGLGFVQFYFGMPLALIIICIIFVPIYYRLKVFTAYEFLEKRFDLKTRSLTAGLFLIQRGFGAGITIFAPAIILSTILGWHLNLTNLVIGLLVIVYTVAGGTRAVSLTHKWQMAVIVSGMFITFILLLTFLPDDFSVSDALSVAGANGNMKALDFSFEWDKRYTFWSGLLGGFFLHLAYFGSDQSQVQRYLSGSSLSESRIGLIFNALLKVPFQFFILLVGIMVFVFYQNHQSPVFFNRVGYEKIQEGNFQEELIELEAQYDGLFSERQSLNRDYLRAKKDGDVAGTSQWVENIQENEQRQREIREEVKLLAQKTDSSIETNDRDYVFISFILDHLPKGLIGLLLAVFFSAAMSSTAAELNALASTTTIDIYKRNIRPNGTEDHLVRASRVFTLGWGAFAIAFACFGTLFENLIQFVNIVGSIFYGTILGVFLVAFSRIKINGTHVFLGAIFAEAMVIYCFLATDISFLWYNVIGCFGVIAFSLMFQFIDLNERFNSK